MDEFRLEDEIGCGSFSIVRQAIHLSSATKVAIKIALDSNTTSNEIEKLRALNHPNIVKLLQIIKFPRHSEYHGKLGIVLEHAGNGDLLTFMQKSRKFLFTEIKALFLQLAKAVSHCHHLKLCQGDLKLENILLDDHFRVMLSDFGMARFSSEIDLNDFRTFPGTIEYAAPEMISTTYRSKLTDPDDYLKQDIWMIGIVLFAMIFNYLPFDGPSEKVIKTRILFANPFPQSIQMRPLVSEDLLALLQKLLTKDPKSRPNIKEVVNIIEQGHILNS